ncbi:nitrous oxide reductase accessory protein NosL [Agriterribacter sp.]|uniref:nitrous oxide reductase accessory protein NosL n=1 Tax=Agriterribacter sp. TaxID=2821509 RepID=UPI002C0EB6E3|nr:nitrous oxide reductase accessory protein NosL [Agriterribacter sp.]HTN08660.1 nitrous oxide reductase accessory protein NosL [Agriterribacter sp.]
MKRNQIKGSLRVILGICAIALFAVNYLPIWQIDLDAPQYPEGLQLFIYADKLAGNVDIINGLNHYIGMKTLHTNDFIEFKILPYLIGFFSLLILATAIIGKRGLLYTVFILFVLFGIVAMVDFWLWEYDYGHNLDPNAAIKVPGMSYQPPLIGFKQLLNFGAYSIPATGGWIFIGTGAVLLACSASVFRKQKKSKKLSMSAVALALCSVFAFTSCNSGPEPIKAGTDQCAFCKMGISDTRFACELITQKGKLYKFDDTHCMLAFIATPGWDKSTVKNYYLANFSEPEQWLIAEDALLLKSDQLKSPMGGNTAAFSNAADQKAAGENFTGTLVSWKEIMP